MAAAGLCIPGEGSGSVCGRMFFHCEDTAGSVHYHRSDDRGVRDQCTGGFRQYHGLLSGNNDIAISNVIGSNLFNSLAVIGVCGVVLPMRIQGGLLKKKCLSPSLSQDFCFYSVCFPLEGQREFGRLDVWRG